MIQRIQTVYLILASGVMLATYFFPLAAAIGINDSLVLYSYKIISLVPDQVPNLPDYFIWPMLGISVFVILLSIFSIFLFKLRQRQLNFIRICIVLLLGLIALFFFYYSPEMENASGAVVDYEIGAYLPVVALVFFILAYRGIISDIKLLRSADRLR